jgi:outer membrane protein OmpA-like peptidoglycan-associated protein
MLQRVTLKRGSRDEAEKPFWISFADLMTALMVLFLVSLSVALMRAQEETAKAKAAQEKAEQAKKQAEQAQKDLAAAIAELEIWKKKHIAKFEERQTGIASCLNDLQTIVDDFNGPIAGGVRLDHVRQAIDFGSRAQFEKNQHELTSDQANELRSFTARFLPLLRKEGGVCEKWVKRVVVEGYTDQIGTYLHNLNLSLNRSQRVMCVLLAGEYAGRRPVTLAPMPPDFEQMIKQLFLVGGYSSNSLKSTKEESRRIELRIEFYQVDEERAPSAAADGAAGACRIGAS